MTNGDRIRQMTDEELADFFCQISHCCVNDASCSMCPIFDGCAQNVMLKQDAIEYLLYMKHNVEAKSPMDVALDTAIEALRQPTIQPEKRHGRWIEKPPYADETVKGLEFQIVCSRCDEQNASIEFDENCVPIAKKFWKSRFCQNCGAKMDGGICNADRGCF